MIPLKFQQIRVRKLKINLNDYLISFSAKLHPAFKKDMENVIEETQNIGFAIEELNNFEIPIFRGGSSVVKIKTSLKLKPSQFKRLAQNQRNLMNQFVAGRGATSPMADELISLFEQIRQNMSERFIEVGLGEITGNLRRAIDSMEVQIVEDSTGVTIGTANWRNLNQLTPPYNISKKSGQITYRKTNKTYNYVANNKRIAATGYWAFQEFGTSNGVLQRAFLMNYSNAIYSEDLEILVSFRDWISEQINYFNNQNRKIIGK